MIVRAAVERWSLREPFTIARGDKSEAVVVVAHVEDGGRVGRGECVPYARYGETVEGVVRAIEGGHATGAAASALDLAALDLDARRSGIPVWRRLGLAPPAPVPILYTIPLRDPRETERVAAREAGRPVLKLKLGRPADDLARVEAARRGAPDARLVVDANEGWDRATLERLAPPLAALGVELIEQPLPAAEDGALLGYDGPIPLCADESFRGEGALLERLGDRYQAVNVKLDKAGGLRPALACIERARALGLRVMVGCMVSTSLAIAPAVLAAQRAEWADLDGPLYLSADRAPALVFDARSRVHPADPALWGG